MLKKINYIALSVVALLIIHLFTSCDGRPKGVLSSKKMENLLVEMHVLGGALQAAGYYHGSGNDTEEYYAALFDKYGISQAEFDSCLVWYTKHPKKFERIYLNVMNRVDTLSAEVRKGKYYPVDSTALSGELNIWNKAPKFVFTKDSARSKLDFDIQNADLLPGDIYVLTFRRRVAPSDSSLNPHAVMYVNYADNVVDSIYTKTRNDSVLRRYTLKFKARKNLKIHSVSGFLLGNDSSKGKMGAYLDSIKLIRKYNPFKQDSIRSAINKADTAAIRNDSVAVKKDTLAQPPRKSLKNSLKLQKSR